MSKLHKKQDVSFLPKLKWYNKKKTMLCLFLTKNDITKTLLKIN